MKEKGAVGWAVLAAAHDAVSTPVSKLLLREVAPAMLAALLYLGAGIGMLGIGMLGLGMARGRRGSMRRGRRLDPWEMDYYRENRALVDGREPPTAQEQAEKARLERILAGKEP